MFCLNVGPYNAAAWISKRWNVVSQVQVEGSENQRGLTEHVYRRVRQIPLPEQDKPNLQAVVTSPGWREMSLSARVVAMTLLALAQMDANDSVTISRRELGDLTGSLEDNTHRATVLAQTGTRDTLNIFVQSFHLVFSPADPVAGEVCGCVPILPQHCICCPTGC